MSVYPTIVHGFKECRIGKERYHKRKRMSVRNMRYRFMAREGTPNRDAPQRQKQKEQRSLKLDIIMSKLSQTKAQDQSNQTHKQREGVFKTSREGSNARVIYNATPGMSSNKTGRMVKLCKVSFTFYGDIMKNLYIQPPKLFKRLQSLYILLSKILEISKNSVTRTTCTTCCVCCVTCVGDVSGVIW